MMLSRRLIPKSNILKSISRAASSSSSTPVSSPETPVAAAATPAPVEPKPSPVAPQAPNYAQPWSLNQRPRPVPGEGPRFEQTAMELQPNPLSAMELIANEPVRMVNARKAVCDGGTCKYVDLVSVFSLFNLGGGPLGHPKIYINLVRANPSRTSLSTYSQYYHRINRVLVLAGTSLLLSARNPFLTVFSGIRSEDTGMSPRHSSVKTLTDCFAQRSAFRASSSPSSLILKRALDVYI